MTENEIIELEEEISARPVRCECRVEPLTKTIEEQAAKIKSLEAAAIGHDLMRAIIGEQSGLIVMLQSRIEILTTIAFPVTADHCHGSEVENAEL